MLCNNSSVKKSEKRFDISNNRFLQGQAERHLLHKRSQPWRSFSGRPLQARRAQTRSRLLMPLKRKWPTSKQQVAFKLMVIHWIGGKSTSALQFPVRVFSTGDIMTAKKGLHSPAMRTSSSLWKIISSCKSRSAVLPLDTCFLLSMLKRRRNNASDLTFLLF